MTAIRVDRITKTFGGVVAVEDVSLEAHSRMITALIGPNGAGKTTLFNVVTGLEKADTGTVWVDDVPTRRPRPWKMSRLGIARTFQTAVGFPAMGVWENLMVAGTKPRTESLVQSVLGPRAWMPDLTDCDTRAREILEEFDLWEGRDRALEDLSAGEIKLVEFARQLMASPRALLLDEPASGIDPSHRGRLAELIRRLKSDGMTILVIDHNLAFIFDIADYVYVLSDGRLLSEGTPEAIVEDQEVIELYIGT